MIFFYLLLMTGLYPSISEGGVTRNLFDWSGDIAGKEDQFIRACIDEARTSVNEESENSYQQQKDGDWYTRYMHKDYHSSVDYNVATAGSIQYRTLELIHDTCKRHGYSLDDLLEGHTEIIAQESGCRDIADYDENCRSNKFKLNYRTADGHCNNLKHANWGASVTPYTRFIPPMYSDGFSTPIGSEPTELVNGYKIPSARQISNDRLLIQLNPPAEQTNLEVIWGQFLSHDVNFALPTTSRNSFVTGESCSETCDYSPPCYAIQVPEDDPTRETECLTFIRNSAACDSGIESPYKNISQRDNINSATAYIDASQVYGFNEDTALSLRDTETGFLKAGIKSKFSDKTLMPYNLDNVGVFCRLETGGLALLINQTSNCFQADPRVNQHVYLTTLHTIFYREHQRLVAILRNLNPHWSAATLYYEARKIVGAMTQIINYEEYIPNIVGPVGMRMLGPYKGYNWKVRSAAKNDFSTAAFRFGHFTVDDVIVFSEGQKSEPVVIPFHFGTFKPDLLVENGIDGYIRGLTNFPTKPAGAEAGMSESMRENLFRAPEAVLGGDLGSINIQRGRDHGLPKYVQYVEACDLGKIKSWNDLRRLIQEDELTELRKLYGDYRNIDLYVGGQAEILVEGGRVGPTFRCILVDSFKGLRDGDRFWYENNQFTPAQLKELRKTTIQKAFCNNGDNIREMPSNPWVLPSETNPSVPCQHFQNINLTAWRAKPVDAANHQHQPQHHHHP